MAEIFSLEPIRLLVEDMEQVMRNTQRCDRDAAEEAVRKLYIGAGRNPPKTFVWFESPPDAIPMAMFCAWVESGKSQLAGDKKRVTTAIKTDESEWEQREAPLAMSHHLLYPVPVTWKSWLGNLDLNEDSICLSRSIINTNQFTEHRAASEVYRIQIERLLVSANNLRRTIGRTLRRQLSERLRLTSNADFFTETIERLNQEIDDQTFLNEVNRSVAVLNKLTEREVRFVIECLISFAFSGPFDAPKFRFGQHDADSAARLLIRKRLGTAVVGDPDLVAEVSRTCGWWCPFPNICIMVDRPTITQFDNNNFLHSIESHACEYQDKWRFYALRGIVVPEWIAMGQFDFKQIEEARNVEVRRSMIDRYGLERYLREAGASLVSQDHCGRLFRMQQGRGVDPLTVVEVKNSTPEPDGTYKMYFLEVPPFVTTARQAVAWTFGLETNEYDPAIET